VVGITADEGIHIDAMHRDHQERRCIAGLSADGKLEPIEGVSIVKADGADSATDESWLAKRAVTGYLHVDRTGWAPGCDDQGGDERVTNHRAARDSMFKSSIFKIRGSVAGDSTGCPGLDQKSSVSPGHKKEPRQTANHSVIKQTAATHRFA
jgi:hypothetical protein